MPFRELVELAKAGAVTRSDLVRSTWHKEWQPADSVLSRHLTSESSPSADSEWSEAVKAAVIADRARHAAGQQSGAGERRSIALPFRQLGGLGRLVGAALAPLAWLFRRVFGRFEGLWIWLGDLWGGPRAWIAFAIPVFFALTAAGLTGLAIEDWSSRDALLRAARTSVTRPSVRRAASPPQTTPVGRRVPLFSEVGRGEYRFFLGGIVLIVAISAYFFTRLVVFHHGGADIDSAVAGGPPQPAGTVRRLLGGRVVAITILFGIAALMLQNSSVFEPSHERVYGDSLAAVARIKTLSERETTAEEWDALENEVKDSLSPAVDELLRRTNGMPPMRAGTGEYYLNYHIRRPLIQVGRYDLPALLREARSRKPYPGQVESIEKKLHQVRKALDAVSLVAPPDVKAAAQP